MTDDLAALREQAASLHENDRLEAVKALYDSHDIRAIPILKSLASKDPSVKVRYVAKKAIYLVRKMMEDEFGQTNEPLILTKHGEGASADGAVGASDGLDGSDGADREAAPSTEEECGPRPYSETRRMTVSSLTGTHISFNMPVFMKAYRDAPPEKRIRYVQASVRYNAHEVLPFLLEQVGSEDDPEVRATLAISIGILGGVDHVTTVASMLKDPDPRVRANAIEGLEFIGHPTVYPIITRFLADPDNRIRANVAKALQGYGKVNLRTMLDAMLSSDKPWMRDSAAYCLSVISSPSFLPLMKKGMADPDREVRRKIRTGLTRLAAGGNDEAASLLESFSDETAIFHVDDEVFAPWSQAAGEDPYEQELSSDDVGVRKAAIERAVTENCREAVPALVRRLSVESEPFIKACIVSALGRLGDEMAISALENCLEDEVARVRANAVEALATLAPGVLDPHGPTLLSDKNNRVRANAIVALRASQPVEALESLGAMVAHPDELHRRSAFWAVSDIGDESVAHFIGSFLDDDSEDLRTRALHYYHQAQETDPRLAEAIIADVPPRVREGIESAVSSDGAAKAFLQELPTTAVDAQAAVRMVWDDFRELSKEAKLDVIDELKSLEDVHSFNFLREVLAKEKDFVVKVAVRRALKSFEAKNFALGEEGGDLEAALDVESIQIRSVVYGGLKQILQLSQDLVVKGKKYETDGSWWGSFPEEFPILNALREDTQDMIAEVIDDEEILKVSICFYEGRLEPFLTGERSLDMNRYANIVTLVRVVKRLDVLSPIRPLVEALRSPVYLLVILTERRVIVFLRGPIEDRQARWMDVPYAKILEIETEELRGCVSVTLSIAGGHVIQLPELRPDEAEEIVKLVDDRKPLAPGLGFG